MKSILVHVDASPRSAERLKLALALARRHDAELAVLYGVVPGLLAMPWAAHLPDARAGALLDEVDRRYRERAHELVARIAGSDRVRWIEADDSDAGRLPWNLARRALTSDLLVLGQFDQSDRDAGAIPADMVTTAIVDSGKPALVVPCAGTFDAAPASVLLAWKPTSEAARAAVAALPWLTKAREVHIAAGEEADEPMHLDRVEHWLRLNGVAGRVEWHSLLNIDIGVGEALLSLATDVSAGLLAMGCYGHSRAREWVVGGVTRTVLRSMTVPTLMVH